MRMLPPLPCRRFAPFAAVLLASSLASPAAFAQWPGYAASDAPRNADGSVNTSAPAPRAADGHPDFSGVWDFENPPVPPAILEAKQREEDARGRATMLPLALRLSQFWNLGGHFTDGLPFTPWAADLHRERRDTNSIDNPDAHCLPLGVMQLHTHGQPRKLIQSPDVLVILYEANNGIRQIFTDGRPLPEDPEPWWYGYSSGHWEGDTLVVESIGFKDLGWLDVEGSPLTTQGRITERYRRLDYGHMEIDVTIDDPKAYTQPWTVTVHWEIMLDTELIEFVCEENEKDAGHLVPF